jgi:hypothetical protein
MASRATCVLATQAFIGKGGGRQKLEVDKPVSQRYKVNPKYKGRRTYGSGVLRAPHNAEALAVPLMRAKPPTALVLGSPGSLRGLPLKGVSRQYEEVGALERGG